MCHQVFKNHNMIGFASKMSWIYRLALGLCSIIVIMSQASASSKLIHERRAQLSRLVPQCLKRFYREVSSDVKCMDKKLGSLPITVRRTHHVLRFNLKSKIPDFRSRPLKTELWLEFRKKGKHSFSNENYKAFIHAEDTRLPRYRTVSESVVVSRGLTEISFNVSDLFLDIREVNLTSTVLQLRLKRQPAGPSSDLQGASVKAFFVFHEVDYTCQRSSVVHSARIRRSLEFIKPKKPPSQLLKALTMLQRPRHSADQGKCGLKDWFVNFDEIGWDEFVIYPPSVMAKKCTGSCFYFPMNNGLNMTAHAKLKNSVQGLVGGDYASCCVPFEMKPLTMLAVENESDIISVRSIANMVATSCACF